VWSGFTVLDDHRDVPAPADWSAAIADYGLLPHPATFALRGGLRDTNTALVGLEPVTVSLTAVDPSRRRGC
jgi:hypothetical protein